MSCRPATQEIDNASPDQESLPQTATSGRLLLLIALSLMAIAAALVRMS
jgi:LPXTG-motif cell wall-anchored protein